MALSGLAVGASVSAARLETVGSVSECLGLMKRLFRMYSPPLCVLTRYDLPETPAVCKTSAAVHMFFVGSSWT